MKATINGVTVEGTPKEIADFVKFVGETKPNVINVTVNGSSDASLEYIRKECRRIASQQGW